MGSTKLFLPKTHFISNTLMNKPGYVTCDDDNDDLRLSFNDQILLNF